MSLILFFIGLGLLGYGRISVANIEAEGPKVRGAGAMLMLPLVVRLVMGFMINLLFISDGSESSGTASTFLAIVDILAMIICAGVAYTLITDEAPTNIIRMPGTDQNQNTEKSDSTETKSAQATKPQPEAKPRPQPRPAAPSRPSRNQQDGRNRRNFPAVMSTAEAASYLNIPESAVMDLINDGKISAARINYRYRISRDVLDDYLSDEQGSTSAE